jgi:hypothetical protein
MALQEPTPDNGTCYIIRRWLLEGQIVRLIGHAPGESAVLDHNIRCNVTPPLGLFLLQAGGGPADLASRLRWILEPGAGGAEL